MLKGQSLPKWQKLHRLPKATKESHTRPATVSQCQKQGPQSQQRLVRTGASLCGRAQELTDSKIFSFVFFTFEKPSNSPAIEFFSLSSRIYDDLIIIFLLSFFNLEFINKSLDQLTVNDIKILLANLMSVDLDNAGDNSIFSLLTGARNRIMSTNEYDSDRSLGEDLNNYRTTPMPEHVRDYLRRYDPTTYNIFFGENRSHRHNGLHIPGYQYTSPSSWPSQQYRPPLCTVDESQQNEPYGFYAKGAPANALEYDKLKILPTPEFRFA